MGVVDFQEVVLDAMSAFRARLLRYQLERDANTPIAEYEAAVWAALDKLMRAVNVWSEEYYDIRSDFSLEVKYLSDTHDLVAVNIQAESDEGVRLLNLMGQLGVSF